MAQINSDLAKRRFNEDWFYNKNRTNMDNIIWLIDSTEYNFEWCLEFKCDWLKVLGTLACALVWTQEMWSGMEPGGSPQIKLAAT